ncbi:MAG: Rrf2 family transcriptional regulator [Melioribacteraceae bacterium]|nr:Rrf2 family transcriptional regulator [Melioribacteraceae bacterium]
MAKKEYDYAIRICAYLAGSGVEANYSITELATKLLISKPFTTKIVYQLKKSNILITTRGKKGGVSLAIDPNNLTVFQVYESMGLAKTVSSCISVEGFCPLPPPCSIHQFFINHENEIINKLKQTTINNFSFSDKDIK